VRAEETEVTRLGKYEILAEVAAGGMASVYLARHAGDPDTAPRVERLVAIKRVHPHLLKMPQFREMFQDEARVASLIRHANVVRLLDIGDDDGELYLVLEYVESASLSVLLREAAAAGVPLPPAVVSRIMADAMLGLHAAHETKDARGRALEVVHRDVSPQNILVGVDGVSQVIDFGIAKASSRLSETTGGAIKGKLAYMSPEQAKGAVLDRRSDVFSAGVVLFEALTGKRLFADARDGSNVLINVLLEPIEPPSLVAPGVPAAVDVVVGQALERVRDERYQTALELHDALVAAIPPGSAGDVAKMLDRYCGPSIHRRRDETRRVLEAIDGARLPDGLTPEVASVERPAPTGMAAVFDDTRPAPRSRAPVWIALSALVSAGAVAATRHYDMAVSIPHAPAASASHMADNADASTASSGLGIDHRTSPDAGPLPPMLSPSTEPAPRAIQVVKRPKPAGGPASRAALSPSASAESAKPADLHPENPY
jgi:serine/threonine protein kinase